MWIFEWDMVGGWHSLLSLVYRGTRDDVDGRSHEGHAAAARCGSARERLQAAFAARRSGRVRPYCDDALRSLEYQETLFDALAAWRQAFLSYYRWLDTGDRDAWAAWRAGRPPVRGRGRGARRRFGHDLDVPGVRSDVRSSRPSRWPSAGLGTRHRDGDGDRRDRTPWDRQSARALAGGCSHGSGAGRSQPAHVDERRPRPGVWAVTQSTLGTSVAVTALVLLLVGLLVVTLTGFTTARMGAGSSLLRRASSRWRSRARRSASRGVADGVGCSWRASGPLLPGLILLFAVLAYLGPLGFWYSFWTSSIFRIVFVTSSWPCRSGRRA